MVGVYCKMIFEKKCQVVVLFLLSTLWIVSWGGGSWGDVDPGVPRAPFFVPYFPIPERAELCGETVPLDSADVRERFDREFTIIVYSHGKVFLWLKRMERYFPWIEKQLAASGLPDDLKYVAVAESDLMAHSISSAGAAGPWQFMTQTAARFGLCQTASVDQRFDFECAGTGAFRYLDKLHSTFNNWALAIAAYNCGEKRVQDEIRRQKTGSFYDLKLPNETERYIFRILAIKEILTNPAKYGYTLPRGAGYRPIMIEKVRLNLPGPLSIIAASEACGISYREFKMLNPSLISDILPTGNFSVNVPEGRGKRFEQGIAKLRAEAKPTLVFHKVSRGDTPDGIARRYSTNWESISQWNKLSAKKVKLGQMLKIYKME